MRVVDQCGIVVMLVCICFDWVVWWDCCVVIGEVIVIIQLGYVIFDVLAELVVMGV